MRQWVFPLLLFLLIGCQNQEREQSQIPPPYTSELRKKREADLMNYLSKCIQKKIDTDENYLKRAELYFQNGEYELALSDVNNAIKIDDTEGRYFLLRGWIYREANRLDEAYQDAERAEALQENSPKLYVLLADILQERKQYAQSEAYLANIMKVVPFDGNAFYVRGKIAMKKGDTLGGLQDLEKAIELSPKILRAYNEASAIYNRQGDYLSADRLTDRAIYFFPDNKELLRHKANVFASRNNWDSTLVYLKRVQVIGPESIKLTGKIAEASLKAGKGQEALTLFESIRKKDPQYPEIIAWIGLCHEKLWRVNTARHFYEEQLLSDPTSYIARNGLWRLNNNAAQKKTEGEEQEENEVEEKASDNIAVPIAPLTPRSIN